MIIKEPTREEFNLEVIRFEKEYNGKLEDLLNKSNYPMEAQKFWDSPIIRGYLSRDSVQFKGCYPDLKADLDQNERLIYECFPHAIPYRDSLINTLEFSRGTAQCDELSKFFQNLSRSSDIQIRPPGDIYEIRDDVYTRFLQASPSDSLPRFILSPNWKEGHATTCLTILDDKTRKPLITIFINSWQQSNYTHRIKGIINTPIYNGVLNDIEEGMIKQHCHDDFDVNIDQEPLLERCVWKRKDGKAVLIVAPENSFESILDPELDELEQKYETVICVAKDAKQFFMKEVKIKCPFIDASHHLQIQAPDRACTLYGLNFIQGLVKFLENAANADSVYTLAKGIETDQNANETLTKIIQEELKKYLPCYYTETGEKRSPEDIANFHTKQRWEIGRQTIPEEIPEFKPPLIKALRIQREKYFQLVETLLDISACCSTNEKQIINNLCYDLSEAGNKFFNCHPQGRRYQFEKFESECTRLVEAADKELCKSGIWYESIRPILKAFTQLFLAIAAQIGVIKTENKIKYLYTLFEPLYQDAQLKQTLFQGGLFAGKGIMRDLDENIPQKNLLT